MKFYSLFKPIPNKERTIYTAIKDTENFVNINKELVNKYHLDIANRNAIIRTLIQFFTQGNLRYNEPEIEIPPQEFYVIKTDIANFFPSINKHKLYQKLVRTELINEYSLEVLKSFLFKSNIKGIPLGMPFSNSLAEVYIEDFDNRIKQELEPVFYVRYVDDILLVKHFPAVRVNTQNIEKDIQNSIDKIDLILKDNGLGRNIEKTTSLIFREQSISDSFDFLGYQFDFHNNSSNKRILSIDIAENKFKHKLLNKLVRFFKSYKSSSRSNKDFWILYYRIKNLTYGVTSNGERGILKFGLGFSYKFINNDKIIKKYLKTIHYYIFKYSKYLTRTQRGLLFSLISIDYRGTIYILGENSDTETILRLLKKRINYNKMSVQALEKIAKSIGCPSIGKSSVQLYKYNLQVQIMKKLNFK